MQETRRQILDILKTRGQATIHEIVADLQAKRGKITSVTVRHHLARLEENGFVTIPKSKSRSTPGRPQYIYTLTDKALATFPNNYMQLAKSLVAQLESHLPSQEVNVIMEDVANTMAGDVEIPSCTALPERLNIVTAYLNESGYEANWEKCAEGYILHTCNCPYHAISQEHDSLCNMDMHLIARILKVVPRKINSIASGDNRCSYLIPQP